MELSPENLAYLKAYKAMVLIRRFEEAVLSMSAAGDIKGSVHPCLGQEAIPVGAIAGLRSTDRIVASYRGHGWALASGSQILETLAEVAHKRHGLNGGRAGSAMLSNPPTGFLGETSIVGAGSPIAAGVGLAARTQHSERVAVASLGDGAMNQGATTEGMVLAAALDLPVIFICENNGWSEMTPTGDMTRGKDLVKRGQALGIESQIVDGTDPFAVHAAVAAAAETCRQGSGPVFLECKTFRLGGHYNNDIQHYRPKEDQDLAISRDPLLQLRQRAISDSICSDEDFDEIDLQIEQEIEGAVSKVRRMPPPDTETLRHHLYGEPVPLHVHGERTTAKEMTYQRAINIALREELDRRPDLLVYGEDVGHAGGIFGVTRSLQKDYGKHRVFDTPIAEAAILGSAVGAGLEGVRTVVEVMWADFIFVALDQVINQAANVRFINRGRLSAPLTIRTQQGVTPGSCAQHSQSIEAILAHIPGIKVGMPATAQDAYEMTRAAVEDPDPTVLIESRSLYQSKEPVCTGGAIERAEGARRHRTGNDLSIITWGATLAKVLEAALELEREGISTTVLDLRWLSPLDNAALDNAVADGGGRILIVHEANRPGGYGAEISAQIVERHFEGLAAPPVRLACEPTRMPASPSLQEHLLPSVTDIVVAARKLVDK